MKKYFQFEELGTSYRQEIIGGLTTFLAMAYILVVNPDILSQSGMDQNAVFVATAVSSAIGCFIMGIFAKYPLALAPGLGLNAFLLTEWYWATVSLGNTLWLPYLFHRCSSSY